MKLRPGSPEEVGMDSRRLDRVRAWMREWMDQAGQHSVAAVVARRGVIVLNEALGRLRSEPGSPPTRADTILWIASVTKPITATAAMILVEEGRIGLNIPVSFYLPEFVGEGKDAVTILHLLTHTSGLQQERVERHAKELEASVPAPPPEPTQHPEISKYLAPRWGAPLSSRPGEVMSYCPYGYILLGEVIRRVSGQSLDAFTASRIFGPLGMDQTCWGLPQSRVAEAALSADPDDLQLVDACRRRPSAAGGVFAPAPDVAAFGQMFLNGGTYGDARILAPTTVAAMTRNQTPGVGARYGDEVFLEACWGLGWQVREGAKGVPGALSLASRRAYCHGGRGGSFLWVDPENDLVGAYLVARGGGGPLSRYPLTASVWRRSYYLGAYQFADAVTAAVVEP